MPKYHWEKTERINGKFLETLDREFECRGTKYKIEVAPAVIKDRDGVNRYYYPSKREELVEDALRRFATAQQGIFLDDRASVTFSLYQLQKELKRNGHSYSKDQIKDALLVCAKTSITVTTEDGTAILIHGFLIKSLTSVAKSVNCQNHRQTLQVVPCNWRFSFS